MNKFLGLFLGVLALSVSVAMAQPWGGIRRSGTVECHR